MVKNPSVNAGDVGLIPGLGRSPGVGRMAAHSSIFAWEIQGHKELDRTEHLSMHLRIRNS